MLEFLIFVGGFVMGWVMREITSPRVTGTETETQAMTRRARRD